jgi:hypothetical protein
VKKLNLTNFLFWGYHPKLMKIENPPSSPFLKGGITTPPFGKKGLGGIFFLTNIKGFSVIFLVIAMLLMVTIGYVFSYLIPSKQKSVVFPIQSSQAFFLAQSGVEFAVRYASDNCWTTTALLDANLNGATRSLGSGRFTLTYNFATYGDTLISVGEVPIGTERRRISVSNFTSFLKPIAFVNATGAYSGAASAPTIVTPAFSVTAGNTIIVCVSSYTPNNIRTVSSITDTAGNTYTICGNRESYDPTTHDQEIWVAANIVGNASNVVTVTFSGGAKWRYVIAAQYSGLSKSSPYDVGSALRLTASGTTHTTNTAVTTVAKELCLGWFVNSDTAYAYSATSPYNLRYSADDSCIVDRIVCGTGTYSITVNTAGANREACFMRTFR